MEITIGKPLPLHPDYVRQALCRSFWRRSDKAAWDYCGASSGGTALDASGVWQILPKHERETVLRYDRRKSQAIARGYQRQILDRFNDHVYRVPATRPEAQGEYGILTADADGAGTKLPHLMKRALRRAQTEGPCYLLADSNQEAVYATKAEEIAVGKRGVITIVGADQVVWWRTWRGVVMEVIILMCDRDGQDYAYYVTEKTAQRINLKAQDGQGQPIVIGVEDEIPHNYGGCPLVAILPQFGDDDAPGNTSQGAPLAESIKRICNVESWLLEETQGVTFTTQVFIGVNAEQVKSIEIGPGSAVCLESQGAGIDKLTADPAQAESLRATLERETVELYRAAGITAFSPTQAQQPESGVAKAFAFNEIEAKLSALAQAAQNAENLVIKRLSTGNGWAYPGDAQYPSNFALPNLAEELDYVIRLTSADLPAVLKDKSIREFSQLSFRLTKEEQIELDAQLEERELMKSDDAITSGRIGSIDLAPVGTPAKSAVVAAPSTDVQATALNGAQVTALQKIMEGVANETLPGDAAKILITEAFPAFDEAKIKTMISSAVKFTPKVIATESNQPAQRKPGT